MFGIFKKKAPPAPVLSDEELELVCGGQQVNHLEREPCPQQWVKEFNARDAVTAVVGRSDTSAHKL